MQEFWIEKQHIPIQDRVIDNNICQLIYIPNECQFCNNELKISPTGLGSYKEKSTFESGTPCSHYDLYNKVWANRCKFNVDEDADDLVISTKRINQIDDGHNCSKCGLWSPMSAPNQPDNTFKCYPCRSRGW